MPLRFSRRHIGGLYTPNPPPTVPVPPYTPRFNDLVANKTTGAGGDYPDGIVWMRGGTYYVDPFDLSTSMYKRAFNAGKPNNNWLTFKEYDGAGTVTFDLRPESAATALGQSRDAAYNDTAHGGSFRNVEGTAGSLRWCFDGAQQFQNGSIHGEMGPAPWGTPGMDRVIFHGATASFTPAEWRRQYDIIRSLRGVADPGSNIPNDSPPSLGLGGSGPEPNGGPYWQTYANDLRFKGNNQPTVFRLDGVTRFAILRADIGPSGEDTVFVGTGSDRFNLIGSVLHEVGTATIAALGPAANWFHPDALQVTGSLSNSNMLDCTYQGHLNISAEVGDVSTLIIDRVWEGMSGATGQSLAVSGHTMGSTNKQGTGAPVQPTCRIGGAETATTANASATSSAKAVLTYLTGLPAKSTHKLVSGQFQGFNPSNPSEATAFAAINQIHTNTGKWLGLVGGDYAFNSGNFTPVNNLLTGYWNAGSLVTLSYHMPNPVTGGDVFDRTVVDLAAMLTPGNAQRTAWLAEMDATAVGLAALRDAGVVVLWRPFHEMNDGSFWWGARDITLFKALWVDMFNYFTTTKGLNNLLWVYGAGGGDDNSADYYPGSAYVDVVGGDHYQDLTASDAHITGLDNLAALGKPMTLTEFGPSPTTDPYDWTNILAYIKARYPQLAYILVWGGAYGMDRTLYTNASAFLNDSWMANRDTGWATAGSGHYFKGFSNGMDHPDGGSQVFRDDASSGGSHTWHAVLTDYGGHSVVLANGALAVPAGCAVDGNGMATTNLATFLASGVVPHQVFRAAYAATELAAVMADYGISFD